MISGNNISDTLKSIREYYENKKPEPHYNEAGFKNVPTTHSAKDAEWPAQHPEGLSVKTW